jgi:hypothetical protein
MKTKLAVVMMAFAFAGSAHAKDPSEGPAYYACRDLMNELMDQYGRAPVCRSFLDANGNSISEIAGQIGLSDDGVSNWMVLTIHADAGSTRYRYNPDQINQVAYMIQSQGRGLTYKGQALYGMYGAERGLQQQYASGAITADIYESVMQTMKTSEAEIKNSPESSFVVHRNK